MSSAYEPLRGRERAVVIGLTAFVLLDVLAVLSSIGELSLLGRIERGEPVSDAEIDGNDTRQGMIGLIQFVLLIPVAVLFIRWLRRAFRNTDALSPGLRRHGHGWAIGGWFVPIMNLWRPKQIVDDTWRAGAGSRDVAAVVHLWWAAWILDNLLSQVAFRMSFSAEEIDELQRGSLWYAISDGFDIVAAVLAIVVVRQITRLQEARATQAVPPAPEGQASFAPPLPGGAWPDGAPERPVAPG